MQLMQIQQASLQVENSMWSYDEYLRLDRNTNLTDKLKTNGLPLIQHFFNVIISTS